MAVYIVIALILIAIFINPSKGIILFYLLSPVFRGFELLGQNLYIYMNAIIVVAYFATHISMIRRLKNNSFFFCILLMSFSLFISNYYGYIRHTPMMIADILSYFSIFVIYDIAVKSSKSVLKFAIKSIVFLSLIICINAIIEVITKQNILLQSLIGTGLYDENTRIITEIRFGLKRAQSLFRMHTTLGGYCLLSFAFLFYLKRYCNLKYQFMGITIIMLIMCLFFTGARSAIIGFAISLLTFIKLNDLKSLKGLLGIAAVIIVLFLLQNYINNIYGTIINSNNANIGSSSDMRDAQYTICLYYFLQSPIVGNGISYIFETALSYDKEILGAESLWFPLMVDQGIIGIISMIIIYLSLIRFLKIHKMLKYTFVVLGFLVYNTMSSIPDVSEVYLIQYIILLVFSKEKNIANEFRPVRISSVAEVNNSN